MAGRSPGHPCGGRRARRRRIAPDRGANRPGSRLQDDVDGRADPRVMPGDGHDGQKAHMRSPRVNALGDRMGPGALSFPVMTGRSPGHPRGGRRAAHRRIAPDLGANLLESPLEDDVDGRDKPGHDGQKSPYAIALPCGRGLGWGVGSTDSDHKEFPDRRLIDQMDSATSTPARPHQCARPRRAGSG